MEPFVVSKADLQLEPNSLADQKRFGFRPRPDVRAWPLEFPIDWGANPFIDNNWRLHLSAWRPLDAYLLEFFETRDPGVLLECLPFMVDWHRYHFREGIAHKYSWYDMSTGQRAAKLAFFIEAAERAIVPFDDEAMQILRELADAHIANLTVDANISRNNHGIFQVIGLKVLAKVVGAKAAEEFSVQMFRKLVMQQFTEEGVHAENSPDYHYFVQNTILRSRATHHFGDPFAGRGALVRANNPWFVFPTGDVARVGDSYGKSDPPKEEPDNPITVNRRKYVVRDLTKSGYAIVRSLPSDPQQSMLFVTGMAHTVAHKHADELGFELFESGRFIFVDTGKYGYKSSPMRVYALSAEAHNTIGLADKSVLPTDIEFSGSLLRPIAVSRRGFRIEGSLRRPGLFDQHRTIEYSPGKAMTVTDRVSSDHPREFVSSLHLAPNLLPFLRPDGFDVKVGRLQIRARVKGAARVETARGQNDPPLGWHCTGYLQMTPTSVVRATSSLVRSATITWSISFGGGFLDRLSQRLRSLVRIEYF
ncbi:heparinase II/III-family protein [Sinorhizobium meliloti]|uniref:heparinase II/III domain-containing protein n=1 Tax=Rhizobium meliloti TaxID=382 RepID=UPI00237FC9A0|nr:heparinase II/III family protein [Sinorhizobium meliloti]MDE3814293.1 heparinase II/III-family protein [Sinorhizobium meliloti]